ncbi:hypothetical protein OOK60_01460 [Trichothermofontia sichuanensis B231]|uniref:hypothetical protein n=1 Tax=Trichothermofontia sichuanensis TaxID=3045816 RepID=UPI002245B172|nr:hypothetical protein [Trichothermofontia sichuanensis]UZQ54778.1 hypothetical protein OOK60_01460 [Trichothermofontia sichuanensis B231]
MRDSRCPNLATAFSALSPQLLTGEGAADPTQIGWLTVYPIAGGSAPFNRFNPLPDQAGNIDNSRSGTLDITGYGQ